MLATRIVQHAEEQKVCLAVCQDVQLLSRLSSLVESHDQSARPPVQQVLPTQPFTKYSDISSPTAQPLQRLTLTKSFMASRTLSLVFCPRTKIAVFSFSTILASRCSRARLTRAFFGLLSVSVVIYAMRCIKSATHTVLSIDMASVSIVDSYKLIPHGWWL